MKLSESSGPTSLFWIMALFIFLPTANMQIAINDTTGIMYTEDKVRYSAEEQRLLQSIDYALPLSVHLVKKVFYGTIVSI